MKKFALLLTLLSAVTVFAKTPQSITFNGVDSAQTVGNKYHVSATASSGLPVTITPINPKICTLTTAVAAGDCKLRATQPGNATYAAAAPINFNITVSPRVPKLARWQVTPTVSVQYDPTVWKMATFETPEHDGPQVLYPMKADKSLRTDVALSVQVIKDDTLLAPDIIASRIAKTESNDDTEELALKEYQAGEEYGVLFAFTAQNDKGDPFVIGRWSFAGDKLDIKSHIVVEFEGVIPIEQSNDDIWKAMDAVIQTYRIQPLPKK